MENYLQVMALGLSAAAILAAMMALAWAVAEATRNGGWADTIWTSAVGIAGVVVSLWPVATEEPSTRQWLAAAFAALWAARLALYLASRTVGHPEDGRYRQLRDDWGSDHRRRLFIFLQIQALAGLPLVAAIALAAHRPFAGLDVMDALAAAVFAAGLIGVTLADWQLKRFKSNPENRGRICDQGLWSLSRHPNYFFEWLVWCAWPVLALDLSGNYLVGIAAVMAPMLMYYLLRYVSGIPLTEAHMARTRGEAFAAYCARTPVFFPKWPKAGITAE